MILFPTAMLSLLAASPASATVLPFTLIEATCSGGIAGRRRTVRLGPDGRLSSSEGWRGSFVPAGQITPAEAHALSQRLDRVAFADLPSLKRGRTVYDGISCMLKRQGQATHVLQFSAGSVAPKPGDAARYQEARAVMCAIMDAANQVKLNPQPIPPGD